MPPVLRATDVNPGELCVVTIKSHSQKKLVIFIKNCHTNISHFQLAPSSPTASHSTLVPTPPCPCILVAPSRCAPSSPPLPHLVPRGQEGRGAGGPVPWVGACRPARCGGRELLKRRTRDAFLKPPKKALEAKWLLIQKEGVNLQVAKDRECFFRVWILALQISSFGLKSTSP